MWARKRIDVGFRDLAKGLKFAMFPQDSAKSLARIAAYFSSPQAFCCLSVRSGFDLLLETVNWPVGSEILFTGLTIADMPRIAREHGLSVVSVDLDPLTLAPSIKELEAKITPQTRAIVVAHLLGGQIPLDDMIELARRHELMLIEDCAQAFRGPDYHGSPLADVSLFSFGSIKTNTALGGGVMFVRDQQLLAEITKKHRSWPQQTNSAFAQRVLKYAMVKFISTWPIAASIRLIFRWQGRDHDCLAASMAKGFAGSDFFDRIRKQPSAALLNFLATRLESFDPGDLCKRSERAIRLARQLKANSPHLIPLGWHAQSPTHWIVAITVNNPREVTHYLWNCGFDATSRSSLMAVTNDDGKKPEHVDQILQNLVILPLDPPMPSREIDRMGQRITEVAIPFRIVDEFGHELPSEPCISSQIGV